MSTTVRKARKRAGIKFVRTPKTSTVRYADDGTRLPAFVTELAHLQWRMRWNLTKPNLARSAAEILTGVTA